MNALILLADGFEDIEAITVIDILRRGGVEVTTAAVGENTAVHSTHSVTITADTVISSVIDGTWDAIVLPGGGEGTENLRRSPEVIGLVRRQRDEGRLICAICAAPLVLADAGVLEPDQHVTCYPTCEMELGIETTGVPVVHDGNIVTGQAPGASMLFALVVLQALAGEAKAIDVARGMVSDLLD